jgi:hypothetical protein
VDLRVLEALRMLLIEMLQAQLAEGVLAVRVQRWRTAFGGTTQKHVVRPTRDLESLAIFAELWVGHHYRHLQAAAPVPQLFPGVIAKGEQLTFCRYHSREIAPAGYLAASNKHIARQNSGAELG